MRMCGKDSQVQGNARRRMLTAGMSVVFMLVVGSLGLGHSLAADTALDESEKAAVRQLQNIASCAAGLVNVYMDARVTDMLACSTTSQRLRAALVTPETRAGANGLLEQWLSTYRAYDAMLLLDKNGICLAAAPSGLVDRDFSADPAFKGAISGKVSFSDAHKSDVLTALDPKSKGWTVAIAAPITVGQEVGGVLLSYVKWSRLEELAGSISVGETGYVFLLNHQNQVIIHPNRPLYGKGVKDPPIVLPSLDQAIRRRAPYYSYEFRNVKTGRMDTKLTGLSYPSGYANFSGLGWIVGAGANRDEIAGELPLWKRLFR